MEEVNFDEDLNLGEFSDYEDQDAAAAYIQKMQGRTRTKGTEQEKTKKIQLQFTQEEHDDLSMLKATLHQKTFNGVIYELIKMGKTKHIEDLMKILEKRKEN